VVKVRYGGQWDTPSDFLPRYKTAIDRRGPAPPELEYLEWKSGIGQKTIPFPKSFLSLQETFLYGGGGGVGKGLELVGENMCASGDARLTDSPLFVEPDEP
jgi:hypothetical protein